MSKRDEEKERRRERKRVEFTSDRDCLRLRFEHWELCLFHDEHEARFRFLQAVYDAADHLNAIDNLTADVKAALDEALHLGMPRDEPNMRRMALQAEVLVQSWMKARVSKS